MFLGDSMARFKSVSKKKKLQRKIIIFLIEIIIAIFIVKLIKKNFKLTDKKLGYITYNYLGKIKKITNSSVVIKTEENIHNGARSPTVYIYNSHQTEKYQTSKNNPYNIDYDVFFASYILKEYLEKSDIIAVVEDGKVSDVLKENNLSYSYSYIASRKLLENAKVKYPTLKYFIDLHRDSLNYDLSTVKINNISYARILFILGLEHENYHDNEKIINALNNKIKEKYPSLTRGVSRKKGKYVNGVYNEDFDKNLFLVEIGGQYNSIIEVNNTLKVFADILSEYIKEDDL